MESTDSLSDVRNHFSTLEDSVRAALATALPLDQGLAALAIAARECATEYMSAEEISECLEAASILCEPESIRNAFARAGKKVKRQRVGSWVKYKVMLPGLKQVESILARGNIEILFVDGERPRTDRKRLADILSQLTGTVRISDPYYGLRSLDALEMIPADCEVQFLTSKTNEDQSRFARHANDLRKERPLIQIRLYPNSNELHDRYLLANDSLLIVGHGLKDIGGRESFIIKIDDRMAHDLLSSVNSGFYKRWEKAKPV